MNGFDPDPNPTSQFTDAEIEAVIDHYDDPSHPDSLAVGEARQHLADLQAAIETGWDDRMAAVREGRLEVAADFGAVVVLCDPERRVWERLLDDLELYDSVDRTVLRIVHHRAAKRLTDRSFEGTDPIVVRKPDSAAAGQRLVESIVAALLAQGVTVRESWAYYGIEILELDSDEWIEYSGYDSRVELADAVERARDKLEHKR